MSLHLNTVAIFISACFVVVVFVQGLLASINAVKDSHVSGVAKKDGVGGHHWKKNFGCKCTLVQLKAKFIPAMLVHCFFMAQKWGCNLGPCGGISSYYPRRASLSGKGSLPFAKNMNPSVGLRPQFNTLWAQSAPPNFSLWLCLWAILSI